MAVGAKRSAVEPGVRDRVDDLLARGAEHRGHNGGGRDPHQDHVIEADLVEGVLERDHALHFVRLDHRGEHVAHGEGLSPFGQALSRQPVGDREDAA